MMIRRPAGGIKLDLGERMHSRAMRLKRTEYKKSIERQG